MYRRAFWLSPFAAMAVAAGPRWTTLFDGRTLAGWKELGKAAWSVEDGCLIGRQGPAGTAGDLMSENQWADFEAEVEWKMKWPGDSGLWFRYTNSKSAYQADILDEPAYPGVLSGSLYCMGKAFIAQNRDTASVSRDGWNTLRVLARGPHFTIHQNGRKVVQVTDATFPDRECWASRCTPARHSTAWKSVSERSEFVRSTAEKRGKST